MSSIKNCLTWPRTFDQLSVCTAQNQKNMICSALSRAQTQIRIEWAALISVQFISSAVISGTKWIKTIQREGEPRGKCAIDLSSDMLAE